MPTISNALNAFRGLFDYNYHFTISSSKKVHNIKLVFKDSDFFHLAGFQYLTDIDIPKSSSQMFDKIDNHKICDDYLSGSKNYLQVNDSYANVKDRIYGLQFLREYIESKNTVFRYIKNMNRYSSIQADFLIKSTINHQQAFIFLRKRTKEDTFCICSFFINPAKDYFGVRSYWLYKSCINTRTSVENVMIDKLNNDTEEIKT